MLAKNRQQKLFITLPGPAPLPPSEANINLKTSLGLFFLLKPQLHVAFPGKARSKLGTTGKEPAKHSEEQFPRAKNLPPELTICRVNRVVPVQLFIYKHTLVKRVKTVPRATCLQSTLRLLIPGYDPKVLGQICTKLVTEPWRTLLLPAGINLNGRLLPIKVLAQQGMLPKAWIRQKQYKVCKVAILVTAVPILSLRQSGLIVVIRGVPLTIRP